MANSKSVKYLNNQKMVGTPFQILVWKALRQIPKGEVRTYKQIAQFIGKPKAVRAVANAIAANKIAVKIPCHRVVRSDGKIGGYRWGVKKKIELLKKEGVILENKKEKI